MVWMRLVQGEFEMSSNSTKDLIDLILEVTEDSGEEASELHPEIGETTERTALEGSLEEINL